MFGHPVSLKYQLRSLVLMYANLHTNGVLQENVSANSSLMCEISQREYWRKLIS